MEKEQSITYVLLGKEAIMLYKTSVNTLIETTDVYFKVGAYSSVKKFVDDSSEWDDFVEISKEEFLLLEKHMADRKATKKVKKGCLSRFLKL